MWIHPYIGMYPHFECVEIFPCDTKVVIITDLGQRQKLA